MANVAELIEQTYVQHASQIPGIKTVLGYEPGEVDRKKLPMIAMFFLLPEGEMSETGPTEDVDYRWEICLYVALSDWADAQAEMRDLAALVVSNFRQHRGDYDLMPEADVFARRLRRRTPPTPGEMNDYLRASWELQVTGGES